MAIITLARERGAWGDRIAHELAEQLNYRYIDKQVVDERLGDMGIEEKHRKAYDEKKPGLFAALSTALEDYVRCLKSLFYEEAIKGDCIFVGRGCQVFFKGIPGVISVRLVAPPETRAQRIEKSMEVDLKTAKQLVARDDRDRAGFNRYFFDADWSDPCAYHAVINTEDLTVPQIVAIIRSIVDQRVTPEQVAEGKEIVTNLALGQSVVRHLLTECQLPIFFLEAECSNGEVTLSGIAYSQDIIDRAKKEALIGGLQRVNCNIRIGRTGA
jgi:cytidylate kinase